MGWICQIASKLTTTHCPNCHIILLIFLNNSKDYQNIAINLFVTGERIKQIESSLIVKLKHKRLLSEFLEIFPIKEV